MSATIDAIPLPLPTLAQGEGAVPGQRQPALVAADGVLAIGVPAFAKLARHVPPAQEAAPSPDTLSIRDAFNRHHGALLCFLRRRLRVPEDALDLAQETYLRMMRYENTSILRNPEAMLFRIAINVVNDYGRSERMRRRAGECDTEAPDVPCDTPTPLREIAARQDLDTLLDAIDKLPPKCKKVFLLSRVHHLSYREIAARCGISVKMVEKHISHALAVCLVKVGGSMEERT
jgi:RNA polymerase sigma-70 factor (ECF subfamily)